MSLRFGAKKSSNSSLPQQRVNIGYEDDEERSAAAAASAVRAVLQVEGGHRRPATDWETDVFRTSTARTSEEERRRLAMRKLAIRSATACRDDDDDRTIDVGYSIPPGRTKCDDEAGAGRSATTATEERLLTIGRLERNKLAPRLPSTGGGGPDATAGMTNGVGGGARRIDWNDVVDDVVVGGRTAVKTRRETAEGESDNERDKERRQIESKTADNCREVGVDIGDVASYPADLRWRARKMSYNGDDATVKEETHPLKRSASFSGPAVWPNRPSAVTARRPVDDDVDSNDKDRPGAGGGGPLRRPPTGGLLGDLRAVPPGGSLRSRPPVGDSETAKSRSKVVLEPLADRRPPPASSSKLPTGSGKRERATGDRRKEQPRRNATESHAADDDSYPVRVDDPNERKQFRNDDPAKNNNVNKNRPSSGPTLRGSSFGKSTNVGGANANAFAYDDERPISGIRRGNSADKSAAHWADDDPSTDVKIQPGSSGTRRASSAGKTSSDRRKTNDDDDRPISGIRRASPSGGDSFFGHRTNNNQSKDGGRKRPSSGSGPHRSDGTSTGKSASVHRAMADDNDSSNNVDDRPISGNRCADGGDGGGSDRSSTRRRTDDPPTNNAVRPSRPSSGRTRHGHRYDTGGEKSSADRRTAYDDDSSTKNAAAADDKYSKIWPTTVTEAAKVQRLAAAFEAGDDRESGIESDHIFEVRNRSNAQIRDEKKPPPPSQGRANSKKKQRPPTTVTWCDGRRSDEKLKLAVLEELGRKDDADGLADMHTVRSENRREAVDASNRRRSPREPPPHRRNLHNQGPHRHQPLRRHLNGRAPSRSKNREHRPDGDDDDDGDNDDDDDVVDDDDARDAVNQNHGRNPASAGHRQPLANVHRHHRSRLPVAADRDKRQRSAGVGAGRTTTTVVRVIANESVPLELLDV